MTGRGSTHAGAPPARGVVLEAVHPVLMARDVAASVAFYARLGFAAAFVDDPGVPRYAGVRRDTVELHLQWADPGQWAHAGDRPAYRFITSDVDALHAEFLAAGSLGRDAGGRYAAPADTPWGTREFHVRDPGGNLLHFSRPLDRSLERPLAQPPERS